MAHAEGEESQPTFESVLHNFLLGSQLFGEASLDTLRAFVPEKYRQSEHLKKAAERIKQRRAKNRAAVEKNIKHFTEESTKVIAKEKRERERKSLLFPQNQSPFLLDTRSRGCSCHHQAAGENL